MTQTSTHEIKLNGKKLKAIQAILANDTLEAAAKQVGISRTTLHRYLNENVFSKELKKAKRSMINQTILRLQRSTSDAARTLAEVCRDKEAPPSSRVSAAREILSNAMKAMEFEDLEARMESIEQRLRLKD
jgi:predicted DNA-binding protein (UPF0251 family)